ncbi:MAG: holo-ACP synthase [Lachnospiraceae bacterium]
MIIGVGTDMIEIQRVKKACQKQAFFARCFTLKEQEIIKESSQKAAGNFAVKEAVSKVFGSGISGFDLKDIEVLRDEKGKPYVHLYGEAFHIAESLGIHQMHVSISNTKEYAIAFAVGEGDTV